MSSFYEKRANTAAQLTKKWKLILVIKGLQAVFTK
jgi:hypothetical protein